MHKRHIIRDEGVWALFNDLPGWSWVAADRPKRTAQEAQEGQEAREAQEAENAPASSSAAAGEGTTRGRPSSCPDPFAEDYDDPFLGDWDDYDPCRACEEARETYEEIQRLLPTVPYEPER